MKHLFKFVLISLYILSVPLYSQANSTQSSGLEDGAKILMFHRFNNTKYPTTNISEENFDMVLRYISENDYNVISLDEAVSKMSTKKSSLPEKSVVLTIDDSFRSVYDVAFPKLKEYNYPFTLFISTSSFANNTNDEYMTIQQVNELIDSGLVDIQAHGAYHQHMAKNSNNLNMVNLRKNTEDLQQFFDITPRYFSYPYGESSSELMKTLKDMGFKAALGQHSGVYSNTSNDLYIPRFSLSGKYLTSERISTILNSTPFFVSALRHSNPDITNLQDDNFIGLKLKKKLKFEDNLNCYVSGVKVQSNYDYPYIYLDYQLKTSPIGRTKLDCTMYDEDKESYKWFGMVYNKYL